MSSETRLRLDQFNMLTTSGFGSGEAAGYRGRRVRSPAVCGWALLIADTLAVMMALAAVMLAAWWVRAPVWSAEAFVLSPSLAGSPLAAVGLSAALVLVSFALLAQYSQRMRWRSELQVILLVDVLGLACNGFIAFLQQQNGDRLVVIAPWIVLPLFIVSMRHLARQWLEHIGHWRIRTVVIGSGDAASRAVAGLGAEPHLGCQVVHVVLPALGEPEGSRGLWRDLFATFDAQLVVFAFDVHAVPANGMMDREALEDSIVLRYRNGTARSVAPRSLAPRSLARRLKVMFDCVAALAALVVLAPILCLVALAVKCDGGPIFFAHTRIGQGGRNFGCLKFRSMVRDSSTVLQNLLRDDALAAAEWEATRKLRHDPRITKIGRLLRASSLDELPQLFNVLRLEMSLVGPRPIVADEVARYGANIAHYYAGRPGLTGLWQISGRSDTSYAQRVALDSEYVSNWSIWRDFSIIAKTIPAVLRGRGAC